MKQGLDPNRPEPDFVLNRPTIMSFILDEPGIGGIKPEVDVEIPRDLVEKTQEQMNDLLVEYDLKKLNEEKPKELVDVEIMRNGGYLIKPKSKKKLKKKLKKK